MNLSYDRYTVYSPAGSNLLEDPYDSLIMMWLMEDDIIELILTSNLNLLDYSIYVFVCEAVILHY